MPKGKRGFVKGDPNINRTGANLGSKKEKAFTEYFDEICLEIAIQNKMEVDEVRKVIYKVGYAKAKEGNYQFYKDILDRIHGQAKNNIDIMSGGMPIPIIPTNDVIQPNNSDKQNTEVIQENKDNSGGDIGQQNDINTNILDSAKPVGQVANPDEYSVGELSAPKEGGGKGLPEHNEGTPILPGQTVGQD